MHTHEKAKLLHKYCNTGNCLRNNFNGYFSKVSFANSQATRLSNQKLVQNLPCFLLSKYQRSIKYMGAKIWNAIPNHVKSLSYSNFLKKYKEI